MLQREYIGSLGEEIATKFLVKRGYKIIARNYEKPWGELDIIAEHNNKLHFVEVKTLRRAVSDETSTGVQERFRPEDNVSPNKMLRLSRIIQTYLIDKHVSDETVWQLDVANVLIDEVAKVAKVNLLDNLIDESR